jgi:hypothetical protein
MAKLINGPRRWKQFVKSSLYDVQDPTFLTFDLDFRPVRYSTDGDMSLYWDQLFADPDDEKLSKNKYNRVEWSAIDFLRSYGSPWTKANAEYLVLAKEQLLKLQESPWYFQSIIGVDSLWKAASRVKDKSVMQTAAGEGATVMEKEEKPFIPPADPIGDRVKASMIRTTAPKPKKESWTGMVRELINTKNLTVK